MTTPTPAPAPAPSPSPTTAGNVIATAQSMPRWALVGIVVGAGLVTWWLISTYKDSDVSETSWTDRATALLTTRGYTREQITAALDHYYRGGMTTQEQDMIAQVIRAIGTPDIPEYSITERPITEHVTPSGTYEPTLPQSPASDETAYWYVTSLGFGWTSSFRGIAQQLYGDPSKGYLIQQVNPKLSSNDYSRLPVGTIIKIPRSTHV